MNIGINLAIFMRIIWKYFVDSKKIFCNNVDLDETGFDDTFGDHFSHLDLKILGTMTILLNLIKKIKVK